MKKLQWLKTKVGLFSDPRILYLLNQPNGDSYIVLWFFLKDLAGTVNDDGWVYVSDKEAMTTQLIAKCLHRRRPFIERGLEALEQVNLIERDENGVIRITIWDELQDFQREERCREQTKERVRRYRERQRQAEPADRPVPETPVVEEKTVEVETAPKTEPPVFEGETVTTPKTMKDYASVQKYQSLFGPMQPNFAKQLIELEKLWGSEATCTAIEIAHDNNVNNIPYIRAVLANSNGRPMRKEDAYERKQRECYEHIDAVLREARREKLQRLQAENAGRNAARNDDGDAGTVSFASLVKTM
jgi:predicted phage replisome organizer